LGLAGCALDGFKAKYQETPVGSSEPIVSGSVESVAERTTAMLKGLGITVVAQRDGTDVRLLCTSDKGKKFVVLFKQEWSSKQGEAQPIVQTTVRLEWDSESDDPLAVRILAGLGAMGG
jgi:hypothetical protein